MAAAMVVSEKMSPHEATPRLVVKMTEPFRYRLAMTWNSAAASSAGHGEEAELVHDEDGWSGEEPHGGGPSPFEVGGGGVIDAMPGVDCGVAQSNRQHGLADAGRPDEQHVGGVIEVAAGRQFADHCFVDRGLGGEVEVVDPPRGGEVRKPHPCVPSALFGGIDFDSEQRFNKLGVTRLDATGPF